MTQRTPILSILRQNHHKIYFWRVILQQDEKAHSPHPSRLWNNHDSTVPGNAVTEYTASSVLQKNVFGLHASKGPGDLHFPLNVPNDIASSSETLFQVYNTSIKITSILIIPKRMNEPKQTQLFKLHSTLCLWNYCFKTVTDGYCQTSSLKKRTKACSISFTSLLMALSTWAENLYTQPAVPPASLLISTNTTASP